MKFPEKCPECGNKKFKTIDKDEFFCQACGLVLDKYFNANLTKMKVIVTGEGSGKLFEEIVKNSK